MRAFAFPRFAFPRFAFPRFAFPRFAVPRFAFPRFAVRRFAALGLDALGSVAGLACGGGSPSQMSAREQATDAACDYYARCARIGAGLDYASRDDCEVKVGDIFQTAWTPADCTMISSTGFDNCLTAIHISECGNPADIANVLFNKCTKMNVCGKP